MTYSDNPERANTGDTRRLYTSELPSQEEVSYTPQTRYTISHKDGKPILLKLSHQTDRIKQGSEKYRIDYEDDEVWTVRHRAPLSDDNATMTQDTARNDPQRLSAPAAIPIRPIPERSTVRPIERHETLLHNEILMPCIGILCGMLALVSIGGYDTLTNIPIPFVVLIVLGALASYTVYRTSSHYNRNGKALERAMRRLHNTDGTINRSELKRVLTHKPRVD
jgi:hypothetical protein